MEAKGNRYLHLFGRSILTKVSRKMTIKKDSSVKKVVAEHPETIPVFEIFGMGCAGCQAALFESIEQGAKACGADIESLMERLNSVVTVPFRA
ncbi:MAG: hypothetical protein A4E65_01843 [Syntrophorhabdus sp. PtaU1.Bin153]|nr:MAG: hypothetical protein A4E65_01843 [Syntrophorhabdus sp. PtaU1.Bin153]